MDKFVELKQLLINDRSVRRFKQSQNISDKLLCDLVELTRYCASGRNLQPLRYKIVNDSEICAKIYPHLKWAGYLSDWDGPVEGERPAAYIIQCLDTSLTTNCLCDDGLQLQAITLGATASGLGGCIIKSFNSSMISEIAGLDDKMQIRYILALGYPVESVVIEDMEATGDDAIKYYRTPDGVHHVPKRKLEDLIL